MSSNKIDCFGIAQFLNDYVGMSLIPSRKSGIFLQGSFSFVAKPVTGLKLSDTYYLRIMVSNQFPKVIPSVIELDKKIPRDGKHHINPDDTFCLGSPLRLRITLSKYPSLIGFAEKILVPYLYAMTYERMFPGKLPADELAHGDEGIITDYKDILKLKTPEQIRSALKLLGVKRRIANKKNCPCSCGKRYGECKYRYILEQYRYTANRGWFREHSRNFSNDFIN